MSQKFIDIVSKVFWPVPVGIEMTDLFPLPLTPCRRGGVVRGRGRFLTQFNNYQYGSKNL
jgi:hypothetical protein